MSKKFKEGWTTLNYTENFLALAFPSLLSIVIEITSSAIRLKICAIAASIKNYK